jgi:hypothetical protein
MIEPCQHFCRNAWTTKVHRGWAATTKASWDSFDRLRLRLFGPTSLFSDAYLDDISLLLRAIIKKYQMSCFHYQKTHATCRFGQYTEKTWGLVFVFSWMLQISGYSLDFESIKKCSVLKASEDIWMKTPEKHRVERLRGPTALKASRMIDIEQRQETSWNHFRSRRPHLVTSFVKTKNNVQFMKRDIGPAIRIQSIIHSPRTIKRTGRSSWDKFNVFL